MHFPAPDASWLQHYGTGAVFGACILESLLVPIPTPPFVMMAGAFLIPQEADWRQALLPMLARVAAPGAAGTALGALGIFFLCYWGGKPAIDRYGKYCGVTWEGVLKFNAKLESQVEIAIFTTRALPMFPISVVSAAAGIMRVNTASFLLWSFLGSVLRYMMLGYLGWLSRGGLESGSLMGHWERWALGAAVLAAGGLAYWWHRRRRKR